MYIVCNIPDNRSNNEEQSNREGESTYEYRGRDLGIYGLFTVLLVVLGLLRSILFFKMMIDTSHSIHMKMFKSLMRAPLYFFDTNSVGRYYLNSLFYISTLEINYLITW